MAEKQVYEKIKKVISRRILVFILLDTMPHKRLAHLVNKVGITYDGIRTGSLPGHELAVDLSEEFFKYPEVGIEVIKALNRENAGELQLVKGQSANSISDLFGKGLIPDEKIVSFLWALIVDGRSSVNKLAKPIIKEFREMDRAAERTAKKSVSLPSLLEEDEEMEASHEIKTIFQDMQDSLIKARRRFLKELSRKEKIEEEYRKIKGEMSRLRTSREELRGKFKSLQREKDSLVKEVEYLKSASREADRSNEEALSHRINQLERENRKLTYELDKRKDEGEKLRKFETENSILKKGLEEFKEDNLLLKEKLNGMEKKIRELRAKPVVKEVKLEPKPITPSFKEKGRRLGIFIDGQYVYSAMKLEYKKKLDYQRLLAITSGARHLVKAVCYIVKSPEAKFQSFLTFLRSSGYEVKVKEAEIEEVESANWSVGIALDVLSFVDSHGLDIVVLVSGRKDMVDLLNALRRKKVRVEIIGCPGYTNAELKERADEFIPIEEDMVM